MTGTVVLDSTPLGLLTQRTGVRKADECKRWCASLLAAGWRVAVPENADYEVRRELLRAGKSASVARLDAFNNAVVNRYIPLTTVAVRLAAELWASARREGRPTASADALDGDVLIAAQALTLQAQGIVVATENAEHLARFVRAERWAEIQP